MQVCSEDRLAVCARTALGLGGVEESAGKISTCSSLALGGMGTVMGGFGSKPPLCLSRFAVLTRDTFGPGGLEALAGRIEAVLTRGSSRVRVLG